MDAHDQQTRSRGLLPVYQVWLLNLMAGNPRLPVLVRCVGTVSTTAGVAQVFPGRPFCEKLYMRR